MSSEKTLAAYPHLYGLIGYPLSHSFSKRYFAEKFEKDQRSDAYYELFPLESIEELPALLHKHPNLKGLNVTIPYKELVLPYLQNIDPAAATVGAVNTIKIVNGQLTGYNTDVIGFGESLKNLLAKHQRSVSGALILGTGGAAKGVAYALEQMNIPFLRISRHPQRGDLTYSQLNENHLDSHPLIVNTSPLGMSPNTATYPDLPYKKLTEQNTLFDLVYNPEKTVFLEQGIKRGCLWQNGLEMLVLQAEGAWKIWTK